MTGQPHAGAPHLARVFAKSAQHGRPAETLTAHLSATLEAAESLRRRVGRIELAESVYCGHFWSAVCLAALTHDAGKVADGFQQMVTGQVRSWGHRHELVSLGFLARLIPDERLRLWVAGAVATHHRPLTAGPGEFRRAALGTLYSGLDQADLAALIGPVDPSTVDALVDWLHNAARSAGLPVAAKPLGTDDVLSAAHLLLRQLLEQWQSPRYGSDDGLAAVLLQGAVTFADHLSSDHGHLHTRQPLDDKFALMLRAHFTARGQVMHEHQLQAGKTEGHLLLRSATGSGKTEAALLWAARQVPVVAARGGVPRVFITLPYLASINAMANRLRDLLGGEDVVGVSHSRAASYHLANALADEVSTDTPSRAASKAVSRANATRLFRETVRVGTPYQLLRGALAGAAHSGILVDAANSVFVLDELHAYDPKRLGYFLATARLWERLGGRIAVLSATLPGALVELLRKTLDAPIHPVHAPAPPQPRHRLRMVERHLTDPTTVESISNRLAAGESVLVVANNVADAQRLYDDLAFDGAILLHSRFRRMDRSRIEEQIIERYGSTATRLGRRQAGLVVATQVVEVSLDVDFDVLFTSAAPLEALLQRFGRVNRLGSRPPADVWVHQPRYGPRARGGPAEYADGVYAREPVEAGWHILRQHDGQPVDEAEANGWLDEVYASEWGQHWQREVYRFRDEFAEAFLCFTYPFDSRDDLADQFDEMFDGTEAVLACDQDLYAAALASADRPSAGRLLADEYLIPMPGWAVGLIRRDRALGVATVDGVYHPDRGLMSMRPFRDAVYRPGEVL